MATIARNNRALDEVRLRPGSLEDLPESFGEKSPAADEVDPLAARERSEGLVKLMNCLRSLDKNAQSCCWPITAV